jgi:hypothetical protein
MCFVIQVVVLLLGAVFVNARWLDFGRSYWAEVERGKFLLRPINKEQLFVTFSLCGFPYRLDLYAAYQGLSKYLRRRACVVL